MIVKLPFPATFDDLMRADGKAELIGGRVIELMATGRAPNRVAKRVILALDPFVEAGYMGEAFTDNLGYAIDPPLLSGRQSFSPDVSFYSVPRTNDSSFIFDAPTFAVEVRSEHDYGPAKEQEYADKRADYFEAGTAVVWDVDPVGKTVTKYAAADPTTAVVFRPGDLVDAEPAVPGWRLDVSALFA
jgi:Uma2 family endonuclease